jgi:hypothetical protein
MPVAEVIASLFLAWMAWLLWVGLISGRLPHQPQDESDERWYRAFMGGLSLLIAGGVVWAASAFVLKAVGVVLAAGSLVLLASAFAPRLRRLR